MVETKQNSREWVHYPDTGRIFEQTFAGPVQVAQVVKVEDAPLVAAAPELLEALEARAKADDMLHTMRTHAEEQAANRQILEAKMLSSAAISKATEAHK